jgi:hypothetical protein
MGLFNSARLGLQAHARASLCTYITSSINKQSDRPSSDLVDRPSHHISHCEIFTNRQRC